MAVPTVDVWWLDLDVGAGRLRPLGATLAGDEVQRADGIRSRADRDRFVAGRAKLRTILGALLGADPATLRFAYGDHGKPGLAGGGVSFNLAHSEGRGLVVACRDVAVGVDLERVRPFAGMDLLAGRFFAPGEVAALGCLTPGARVPAFFRCWTRKEAVAKGLGLGLSMPLGDFEVSVERCDRPAVRWTGPGPALTEAWSLLDLSPDDTWAAAVAVGAAGADVVVHTDPAPAGSS